MATRISRTVAVIGGGSAGVVTARCLAEAGHSPILFEASASGFGGIWNSNPENPVVYNNLETNLPTVVMQSVDLDFPTGVPSYVTPSALGDYIAAYARKFGVDAIAKFNSRVTQVSPVKEADSSEAWQVQWTCGEKEESQRFSAVAVCNGHYEAPYIPNIPGQAESPFGFQRVCGLIPSVHYGFQGTMPTIEAEWLAADSKRRILHSKHYRKPEDLEGRSVLVVGGRSSGVDIARELRGVASWVYVLEKGCSSISTTGTCTHVPLGTRLSADGALVFETSEVLGKPVDCVILATGYLYDFPFLPKDQLGMEWQRFVNPLYMHILHARRPTLAFIGIPLAVPCPIPMFEAQAKFTAEQWALVPSELEAAQGTRLAWVDRRRADVGDRPMDMHFMGATTSAWEYMRQLTAMAGVEGDAYDRYCRRMELVEEIYEDRCSKRPEMPWDDDWYRRCEYTADWATGRWTVRTPPDHKCKQGSREEKGLPLPVCKIKSNQIPPTGLYAKSFMSRVLCACKL